MARFFLSAILLSAATLVTADEPLPDCGSVLMKRPGLEPLDHVYDCFTDLANHHGSDYNIPPGKTKVFCRSATGHKDGDILFTGSNGQDSTYEMSCPQVIALFAHLIETCKAPPLSDDVLVDFAPDATQLEWDSEVYYATTRDSLMNY